MRFRYHNRELSLGLDHTAYVLRAEARLEHSPHFNDYIPRGELVELLSKALLYIEVETHCKGDGLMITDCTKPFSLLKRHECAVDMMEDVMNGTGEKDASARHVEANGVVETPLKRKADVPAEGDTHDRRIKRSIEPEPMDTGLGRDCTCIANTSLRTVTHEFSTASISRNYAE